MSGLRTRSGSVVAGRLRWWLAVATILLVGALAACGGGSGESSSDTQAATETTSAATETTSAETDAVEATTGSAGEAPADAPVEGTLTFQWFTEPGAEREWWTQFIKDFEAKYPDAQIEETSYSVGDYFTKQLTSFSAGTPPDISLGEPGAKLEQFVRPGKIAPLNDLVDLSYYSPASLSQFTAANGDVYAVPLYTFVLFTWYNKDIFAEHQLEVPTSWDELLSACETLSAAGVIPIALGNSGQDGSTAQFFNSLLYQYEGASADYVLDATYGENGASWTDSPFVAAATRFQELVDADCFPPGFAGITYEQMSNIFLQGQAAMLFTGSWFTGQFAAGGSDFEVDIFPLPDVPDAAKSTQSLEGILGGATGLIVSTEAAEDNPALVAAFLDSFGAAADDYANSAGLVSSAVEPHPTGGPLQVAIADIASSVGEIAPLIELTIPGAIGEVGQEYYQNVQALGKGDLTPDEFAQAMADAAERDKANFPPRSG